MPKEIEIIEGFLTKEELEFLNESRKEQVELQNRPVMIGDDID